MKTSRCLTHHLFDTMRRTPTRLTPRGFSLVELVVVVAIVTALVVLAAPYTLSAIRSASLTSAGDTMNQTLSQAQQRALTENRPVGVDFYFYPKDGISACHAVQVVTYDPVTNTATPLEAPVFWQNGRAVLLNGALSPLFSGTFAPSDTGTASMKPFSTLGATFKRVLFYPDGSTALRTPLGQSYVTLISVGDYKQDIKTAPANYYTIQIDPVTGRTRAYRP